MIVLLHIYAFSYSICYKDFTFDKRQNEMSSWFDNQKEFLSHLTEDIFK